MYREHGDTPDLSFQQSSPTYNIENTDIPDGYNFRPSNRLD